MEGMLHWEPRTTGPDGAMRYKPGQGRRTLKWVATALVLGLVLPTSCAGIDGVLNLTDMRKKLCAPELRWKAALKPARDKLKIQCYGAWPGHLSDPKPGPHDEAVVVAYFPGLTTGAWPLAFAALSLAVLWFAPRRDKSAWPKHRLNKVWFATWLAWTALTISANLLRELASTLESGRRFFSHTNWDIARWSAASYLGSFCLLSAFIATIWVRWLAAFTPRETAPASETVAFELNPAIKASLDPERTQALTHAFEDWQHVSVLIVAAFIPGAFLYWQAVHRYHDVRYVFAAGVYHIMFAATWYIVSRPLIRQWNSWHHERSEAIAALGLALLTVNEKAISSVTDDQVLKQRTELQKLAKERLDALIATLKEIQPVPLRAAIAAAVISTATVLAPLYQLTAPSDPGAKTEKADAMEGGATE